MKLAASKMAEIQEKADAKLNEMKEEAEEEANAVKADVESETNAASMELASKDDLSIEATDDAGMDEEYMDEYEPYLDEEMYEEYAEPVCDQTDISELNEYKELSKAISKEFSALKEELSSIASSVSDAIERLSVGVADIVTKLMKAVSDCVSILTTLISKIPALALSIQTFFEKMAAGAVEVAKYYAAKRAWYEQELAKLEMEPDEFDEMDMENEKNFTEDMLGVPAVEKSKLTEAKESLETISSFISDTIDLLDGFPGSLKDLAPEEPEMSVIDAVKDLIDVCKSLAENAGELLEQLPKAVAAIMSFISNIEESLTSALTANLAALKDGISSSELADWLKEVKTE